MRLLFVDDLPSMIKPLVDVIQERNPEWVLDFAGDIRLAWGLLCTNVYDVIIMDVMLPGWPHVRPRSEGIYLIKWLRVDSAKGVVAQAPRGSPKAENRKAEVIFLTSRNVVGVKDELREHGLGKLRVIGRLEADEVELFNKLKALVKQRAGR